METNNNKIPDNRIETFDGISVALPSVLEDICIHDPELENNLKTLLYRMQKYLGAEKQDKPVLLRHIIYQLRGIADKYPDLKELLIDFAIDNSEDTKLNGELKTTILLDWINYTEEQMYNYEETNKSGSNSYQDRIIRHIHNKIDDVIARINGFIRINPC